MSATRTRVARSFRARTWTRWLGLLLTLPAAASHAQVDSTPLPERWELWPDAADAGRAAGWAARLSAPGGAPEGLPGPARAVRVPGPWEQLPELAELDGVAWLRTTLELPASPPDAPGPRRWLRFEQVDHAVDAWLGGAHLGRHEGGYEAFEFELPEGLAPGTHPLVLRVVDPGARPVDGLLLATTPHAKQSWYHNHGGLLGPVSLVEARGPRPRLGAVQVAPDGVVELQLELLAPRARAGSHARVELRLEHLGLVDADLPADAWPARATVAAQTLRPRLDGEARATLRARLRVADPARWSPEHPALHRVVVAVEGARDARTVGFREVRLDADGLHLDGRRRVLLGVLDQPHDTGRGGTAPPRAELVAKARAVRAAGFDLVRAHVRPAWPAFLDACDALGLMVLQEPAIGWLRDDPGLRPRLERELDAMLARDAHHPSIVLWGVLNELSGEAWRHGAALALRAAAADPRRPVLEDSGGFLGARYVPAGGSELLPMLDEHVYPPAPVPPAELRRMQTLGAAEGPSFVSEFGYGALLDTARARAGFTRVAPLDAGEAALFDALHAQAVAARERGDGWFADALPRAAFARVHAEALAAMLTALRRNAQLSMITLTQWQAVSREPSAGLLAPWGEPRAALATVGAVLRATPAELDARAAARHALVHAPPPPAPATRGLPDGRAATLWCLDDPDVRAFARREGFAVVEAAPDAGGAAAVALARDPEGLRARLGLDGHLALLRWIHAGGTLLALLEDPEEHAGVAPVGGARGLRLPVDLPVPALVARAAGNFLGRFHVALRRAPTDGARVDRAGRFAAPAVDGRPGAAPPGCAPALLDASDALLAPTALLAGPAPDGSRSALQTLDHLGRRVGDPVQALPFGRGWIVCAGLPLLDPVDGVPAPARDRALAELLVQLAAWSASDTPLPAAPPALDATERARASRALDRVQAVIDLVERRSAQGGALAAGAGSAALPAGRALALQRRALERLAAGDGAAGLAGLEAAADAVWSAPLATFLEREARVLAALTAAQTAPERARREAAFDAWIAWRAAVEAQFEGRHAAALEALARARATLDA